MMRAKNFFLPSIIHVKSVVNVENFRHCPPIQLHRGNRLFTQGNVKLRKNRSNDKISRLLVNPSAERNDQPKVANSHMTVVFSMEIRHTIIYTEISYLF